MKTVAPAPVVVRFTRLTGAQRALIHGHPARTAGPVESRVEPGRWIAAFFSADQTPVELYEAIECWAESAGLPHAQRIA